MAISNSRTGYLNGATSGWAARSLFSVGSNLYAVVLDTSAVKIRVHKSTDGATFTEMDSAHAIAHTNAVHSYDAGMPLSGTSAGLIHVAYRTATNTVRVRTFNTATDTWASADIGTSDAATDVQEAYTIRVAVRSDGDVLVLYRDTAASDLFITRYEGSSWASSTISTTNTSVPLDMAITDNSDMAHIYWYVETIFAVQSKSLSNANTVGVVTSLDTSVFTTPTFSSFSGYVNDAGTYRLGQVVRDTGAEYDFYRNTSPATVAWTGTASLSPISVTNPGSMGAVTVPYSGQWFPIWSGAGRGSIHMDASASYATPSFGTDIDLITSLGNDPVVYAIAAPTGVPVLYTDLTGPTVDILWATGGPPPASPFSERTAQVDVAGTAGTSHTATKPPDMVDNDVAYIWLLLNGGSISAVPTGFNLIGSETSRSNPKYFVYGKVITSVAGEGAWTFTTTSVTKTSITQAFGGVDQTTPEDAAAITASGATGSNAMTVGLAPTYTTVTNGALLLVGGGANTSTVHVYVDPAMKGIASAFSVKRQSVGHEVIPTAGAVGTRTFTSTSSSLTWTAIMFALRPASTGASFTSPKASLTLTPQAPSATAVVSVTSPVQALTLTALTPSASAAVSATSPVAALTIAALTPSFTAAATYTSPVATLSLTAITPSATAVVSVTSPAAALTLAALTPSFTTATSFTSPLASLTVSPQAPSFSAAVSYTSPIATLSLAALTPSFSTATTYVSPVAALTVSPQTPTYTAAATSTSPVAAITLAALTPSFSLAASLTSPTAALTVAAQTPTYTAAATFTSPAASLSLSALTPSSSAGVSTTSPVAALSVGTLVPSFSVGISFTSPTAALALNLLTPSVTVGVSTISPVAALTLTGKVPTYTAVADLGIFYPLSATVALSRVLSASVSLDELTATVALTRALTASPELQSLSASVGLTSALSATVEGSTS